MKQKTKVNNMISNRGNVVANQFRIRTNKGVYFQSYNSIICFVPSKPGAKILLDKKYWDYSRTTGTYRNMFLGETIKETRQKIENKEYLLKDLN